ncbi:MAG: putative dehydrogenase [Planctomycetota bacterium]|jgi:predicted dehydrogenase
MTYDRDVRVAIVGLGFGSEFLPIYQALPGVEVVAVCQRTQAKLDAVGDAFGIKGRYTDYAELLKNPDIDAVHINTPILDHAAQALAALEAGKHVACTVPMATSVEDCRRIVEMCEKTGLTYMMMETVVYSREFLFMKRMLESGELGDLQYLQASHQQDMDGWPEYWPGLPPMHYATHCVGPCLALAGLDAESVGCLGSGRIRSELAECYGSPFAVESAQIRMVGGALSARVYRSLFDTARQYRESFDVYGSKKSVEWPLVEGEDLVIHTAKKEEHEIPERMTCPDFAELLPEEIRAFTTQGMYDMDENMHPSFTQGSGHGGSHPHLVYEFVSALREGRAAFPNARQSANWTCVGILAHESALAGGELKDLPEFTLSPSSH